MLNPDVNNSGSAVEQPQLDIAESQRDSERLSYLLLGAALTLVLLFHGIQLFHLKFIHTYDALIHIFFAAHYAETWFDPWEPRWYTGFMTVAYPPLSHYLIALLSKATGLLYAFAIVQLLAILQLTIGVYRFSRLLSNPVAAGFAALALALSSAIAQTVHVFGQLPTTLSLGFLLNAIPFAWTYVRKGQKTDLLKSVFWMAATTAGHHVTTLFGSVFFTGPLVLILILEAFRFPRPQEPAGNSLWQKVKRRIYRVLPRLYRSAAFGTLAISMLVLVVFPYWYWSGTDPILQVSIPHGSRENFLERRDLGFMFWIIPWLTAIWFLPYSLYKGLLNWRWPVIASICLLFILGTGGTTNIPRLLLRGAFDVLTLDRFTFWATMLILPFVGMALESLTMGRLQLFFDANLGLRVRQALLGVFFLAVCASIIMISTLPNYRKMQPDPIDIQPIINFIEKDEHWRYRYLTLGFGDQMAWLSANTRASTPDGNYHSARRLPELTTTPVERLEGAKYTGVPGIGSLEQFLKTPEKYNLKYVFSNDAFYDPILFFNGWHSLGKLENGIEVWEREDIPPLPERLPRKTWPIYQRLMWGLLPMLAFFCAYLVLFKRTGTKPPKKVGVLLPILCEDSLPPRPPGNWQKWRNYLRPVEQVFNFKRRAFVPRLMSSSLVFLGIAAPLISGLMAIYRVPDTPEYAVLAYWDALDFKRFGQAYRWIEARNGLDYERWLLDMSVVGGLRTGYAKLDSLQTQLLSYTGQGKPEAAKVDDRALIQTELSWFTSLAMIEDSITQELIRTDQGWRILEEPKSSIRPRKRFISQPGVNYYRSPRRLTTDATAAHDVLDRPKLAIHEARLIMFDTTIMNLDHNELETQRQYSIVGLIENLDARPADLTVTGILRDAQGSEVSRNNTGTYLLYKLLPGESSPFRIDFNAVSAPTDPETVWSFEVFPKAVVTSHNLERDLAAWTSLTEQGLRIHAVNLGTNEATIPRALISLYDDQGLAWVKESYSMESIAPQDSREWLASFSLPPGYTVVDISLNTSGTDLGSFFKDQQKAAFDGFSVEYPDIRAYLVQLHAFYRE